MSERPPVALLLTLGWPASLWCTAAGQCRGRGVAGCVLHRRRRRCRPPQSCRVSAAASEGQNKQWWWARLTVATSSGVLTSCLREAHHAAAERHLSCALRVLVEAVQEAAGQSQGFLQGWQVLVSLRGGPQHILQHQRTSWLGCLA